MKLYIISPNDKGEGMYALIAEMENISFHIIVVMNFLLTVI